MSTKPQIELFLENENGTQQVAYPFVESDHVSLTNGMDIDTMIRQDVSMPTVTHEDLSFKVGVGDQDVSSAIVDSSVAEMTIKGKTYQNILPEPSTHVLSNNKEMFKVNEGLDPNVEIVDGVSKSAILSGQTLVNVLSISNVSIRNGSSYSYNYNITPQVGEKYLIKIKINSVGVTTNINPVKIQPCGGTGGGYFNITEKEYCVGNEITKIFTIVDGDNITNGTFTVWCRELSSGEFNADIIMIKYQEGMENWDIPYFEGMTSVKAPVLKSVGKNLFNSNNTMDGYGFSVGEVIVKDTWFISDYIEVKPNLSYIISASDNSVVGRRVNFYDKDKNFVETGRYENLIITVPNNNKIFYMRTNADLSIKSSYQIEQGTVATSYEPYKANILSTQINLTSDMFEQGGITTAKFGVSYSAVKTSRTDRIRVKELIPVKPSTNYYLKLPTEINGWCNMYDRNGLLLNTGSINANTMGTTSDETYYVGVVLNKKDSSLDITPSEIGGKTMFLSQEVVLRSLPNGVKDTLNLMTGEYVQRIGEVILDGTQFVTKFEELSGYDYCNSRFTISGVVFTPSTLNVNINCDKFPVLGVEHEKTAETVKIYNQETYSEIRLSILKSKLATIDGNGVVQYLQSNPVTVQYELATPVIKTVDLSSSGNWEKVVLDGSERWESRTGGTKYAYTVTNVFDSEGANGFCDTFKFIARGSSNSQQEECVTSANTNNSLSLFTNNESLSSVGKLKTYLQSNPITLWYQTATHQDSTQVKQPIFFKDGHIQLSSGADNSLIPTLDYQAKTSNSYVMDLMKTNTKYTMKAKTASGTFTIDGTSYGAGTNGTFTTPSSMTNKFLVMSNKTNEEVMILEGDVVSKTIPYFKGIKSAFEDEGKIEVLSTGKNVFAPIIDETRIETNNTILKYHKGVFTVTGNGDGTSEGYSNPLAVRINVEPNTNYTLSYETDGVYGGLNGTDTVQTFVAGIVNNKANYICFDVPPTGKTFNTGEYSQIGIRFDLNKSNTTHTFYDVQLEKGVSVATTHETHKSNSTKIPLLSPLRSLPNGVCDELIIDRMKKKATLIQRIDKIVFDGRQRWLLWNNNPADVVSGYVYYDANNMGHQPKSYGYTINDKLPHNSGGHMATVEGARYTNYFTASLHKSRLGAVNVNDTTANSPMFQKWYTENPMTMYYELETPVITEVDLEGFPYVYKDGHIFLNGEITPVTEIKYSINQQHQIEASNQDIIRHQKEIDYLYKLIGEYVRVDYKNTLLSLNLELK